MSDRNLQELTIQMKKEAHAKTRKVDPFSPLAREIKRVQGLNSSFKETSIPGNTLSKVLPSVFIKKITVDNNPDNSASLNETRRDPHISDHPVHKKGSSSKTMQVGRKRSPSYNPLGPSGTSPDEFSTSVELTISVKQLFDDDDMLYEILSTLNIQQFLRLKIIAVLDNQNTEAALNGITSASDISKIITNESRGTYVIGGRSGIPIPQDYSKNLSPLSNEFEVSSDGSIIKNITIKRAFQFTKSPENLVFYVQAYYDIFENPEFERELGVTIGSMLKDADLSRILVGQMMSEVVFRNSELMSKASVFTRTPPGAGPIGTPYAGEILEVRPDVYAQPSKTTRSGANESTLHQHDYYVDSKGNGYTNIHKDKNNRQHVHIIRSFKVSSSGIYDDLEETFTEFEAGSHIHNLPLSRSNALYRRLVPIDYIVDNRSQGSLVNLRIQTSKTLEDAFSFLRKARARSNMIRPIGGSSELGPLVNRNSKDSYFTVAMYSSDPAGNCRFAFGFDYPNWIKHHTRYGKYMASFEQYEKYAKIENMKIIRRRLTNSEYSKKRLYSDHSSDFITKSREAVVCDATAGPHVSQKPLSGSSATATVTQFSPAGLARKGSSGAMFYMVCDRSYTVTSPSSVPSPNNTRKKQNEDPILNSGVYVYGVEFSVVDNTEGYLLEAQRSLGNTAKRLKDYISIGQKKENHSGSTREFTKAFRTKATDDLAKSIVDESMQMLVRVFVDESGKTLFASKKDFEVKAKKMYNAIRPKSGSLFAAERYLKELQGITSYIKTLTNSESVGVYAIRKQGGDNQTNSDFPSNSQTRLKKVKHYFSECFDKSNYEKSDLFFKPRPGLHIGLSEVSISNIHPDKNKKGNLNLKPRFGRLNTGKIVPIDEAYIKEKMFSDGQKNRGSKLGLGESVNTFKIVENSEILSGGTFISNVDALSSRNIMGNSELEKQISELQEDGWLKEYRKPTAANSQALSAIALGSELTEKWVDYMNSGTHRAYYLSSLSKVRGSFRPIFSRLSGQRLRRLARENRPVLCRLTKPNQKDSYNACYDQYFIVMPDRSTKLYSPVRKSMGPILDPSNAPYSSEVITSNPNIKSATTTNGGK